MSRLLHFILTVVVHIISRNPQIYITRVFIHINCNADLLKQDGHETGVAEQDASLCGGATGRVSAFVQGQESKHHLAGLVVHLPIKVICWCVARNGRAKNQVERSFTI